MVFCILALEWTPSSEIPRSPTTESNAIKLAMDLVICFTLWIRLKLYHCLLDRSLAGICNRSLLLYQFWVISRKVVFQFSCVAKVFKLSSTHLRNLVGLVNAPLNVMQLKMLPYSSFKEVCADFIGLVLAIAAILLPLKHKQLAHVLYSRESAGAFCSALQQGN